MNEVSKIILHYTENFLTVCEITCLGSTYFVNVIESKELIDLKDVSDILASLPDKIKKNLSTLILSDSFIKYLPLQVYNIRKDKLQEAIALEFASIFGKKTNQWTYQMAKNFINEENVLNCFAVEIPRIHALQSILRNARIYPKIIFLDPIIRFNAFSKCKKNCLAIHLMKNALLVHIHKKERNKTKIIPFKFDEMMKKIKSESNNDLSLEHLEVAMFSSKSSLKSDKNADLIKQISTEISIYLEKELEKFLTEFIDNMELNRPKFLILTGPYKDFVAMPNLSNLMKTKNTNGIDEILNIQLSTAPQQDKNIFEILPVLIGAINTPSKKDNELKFPKNINRVEYFHNYWPIWIYNSIMPMLFLTASMLFTYLISLRKNVILKNTSVRLVNTRNRFEELAKSISAVEKIAAEKKKMAQAVDFIKAHQDALIEFFNGLQMAIAEAGTTWLDIFELNGDAMAQSKKTNQYRHFVKIAGKMLVENMSTSPKFELLTHTRFDALLGKIRQMRHVSEIHEIKVQNPENYLVNFRCNIVLDPKSPIFDT